MKKFRSLIVIVILSVQILIFSTPTFAIQVGPSVDFAVVNSDGFSITVAFNQPLNQSYSITRTNFSISGASILGAKYDRADNIVVLTVNNSLIADSNHYLSVGSNTVQSAVGGTGNSSVSELSIIKYSYLQSVKNEIDMNHDGIHIDDIIKYSNSLTKHDITGDASFDKSDLLFALLTVGEPSIQSLSNSHPYSSVVQDSSYTLPTLTQVIMSDQSIISMPVSWNPATIITSQLGPINVVGTVPGLSQHVTLTVNVLPKNIFPNGTLPGLSVVTFNHIIGIPNNTTVKQLIDGLYIPEGRTVLVQTSSIESTLVDQNAILTSSMVVIQKLNYVIEGTYTININHTDIVGTFSDFTLKLSQLSDTTVNTIKILNDISNPLENVTFNHAVFLTADHHVTIDALSYTNNSPLSWSNYVSFRANAKTISELNTDLNSLADRIMVVNAVSGFTGELTLIRAYSPPYNSYFKNDNNHIAFVNSQRSLQGALDDTTITQIYLTSNVYDDYDLPTLVFPSRSNYTISSADSSDKTIHISQISGSMIGTRASTVKIDPMALMGTINTEGVSGVGNNDKTHLILSQAPASGNKYVYKTYTLTTPIVNYSDILNSSGGWTDIPPDGIIPAQINSYVAVAEVDSTYNNAIRFGNAYVKYYQ